MLQRLECGRRILDQDMNLGLPAAAGECAKASDVGARRAEEITDVRQFTGLVIEIERQIDGRRGIIAAEHVRLDAPADVLPELRHHRKLVRAAAAVDVEDLGPQSVHDREELGVRPVAEDPLATQQPLDQTFAQAPSGTGLVAMMDAVALVAGGAQVLEQVLHALLSAAEAELVRVVDDPHAGAPSPPALT